jgi:hypothetical protein
MECLCRSLHLDAGSLDHLRPLFGRFDNKCGELRLCANKGNVTQLKGPRGELRIGNASVNLAMESFHDVDGGLAGGADARPSGSLNSAMGGTSGSAGERAAAVTPNARILPALMCSIEVAKVSNMTGTLPERERRGARVRCRDNAPRPSQRLPSS